MHRDPEPATDLGYLLIGKAKLPKGLSFPIKRSCLDEFLRREAITSVTGVGFSGECRNGSILSADYYGPRRRNQHHTLNIWTNAVPSAIRASVESLIVNVAFPSLAMWLQSFSDVSLLRARTDHSIRFVLEQGPTRDGSAAPAGTSGLRLVQDWGLRRDQ
jgi:hypothetical protein